VYVEVPPLNEAVVDRIVLCPESIVPGLTDMLGGDKMEPTVRVVPELEDRAESPTESVTTAQ
jgi:hypothetical protein